MMTVRVKGNDCLTAVTGMEYRSFRLNLQLIKTPDGFLEGKLCDYLATNPAQPIAATIFGQWMQSGGYISSYKNYDTIEFSVHGV